MYSKHTNMFVYYIYTYIYIHIYVYMYICIYRFVELIKECDSFLLRLLFFRVQNRLIRKQTMSTPPPDGFFQLFSKVIEGSRLKTTS